MVYCQAAPYLLTSYLYCSSSSLWVMTNWAFLFVKTKFPMILPKTSGLKEEARDTHKINCYVCINSACLYEALSIVPTDSLHQCSEHTLNTALWNILQQLPADPLPHHVWAGADGQPRSHHCQHQTCRESEGGFCVSMDDAMNNQESIYFNKVGERKTFKCDWLQILSNGSSY